MNCVIRWKDCNKSPAVIAHLEAKISRFDEYRFVMPDIKAEIVHYPKRHVFATRLNLQVKNRGIIRAEAKADDILTAINLAVEKIADQLRRVKTRYEK